MLAYIVRRILATIPVMAIVALFVFSLLYIAPGDPAAIIAGDQATPGGCRAHPRVARPRPAVPGPLRRVAVAASCTAISAPRSSPTCRSATMIAQRIEPTLSLMMRHARCSPSWSRCRWACWPPGRPAPGSTASSWRSRCSASRVPVFVRRLSAGLCLRAASSTGCRCRATRRSRTASGRGCET